MSTLAEATLRAAAERHARTSGLERRAGGVVPTPAPVVHAALARVDALLKSELGVTAGLASAEVQVIDPAVGTGVWLAALLLTPIPFSLAYGDGQALCFLGSAGATALAGGLLFWLLKSHEEMSVRDGFFVVTFGWIAYAVFGALPYLCSGVLPHPVDAFFESMSGFATAGASVFRDVDVLVVPALSTVTPTAEEGLRLADDPGAVGRVFRFMMPSNIAGTPAVSLPTGLSSAGVPTGVQLVGNLFDEARLLAVAHAFQARTAHHTLHPELST